MKEQGRHAVDGQKGAAKGLDTGSLSSKSGGVSEGTPDIREVFNTMVTDSVDKEKNDRGRLFGTHGFSFGSLVPNDPSRGRTDRVEETPISEKTRE
jgi:hypothetical protein